MSLAKDLDTIRSQGQVGMPSDALAAIQDSVKDLSRSGIVARSLKVGDQVADFELPNAVGQTVGLYETLKEGPVVITFYRGGWCPFCSAELEAYQGVIDGIRALGATLFAVSPQLPDQSLSMTEKQDLTFEVLSDIHNDVARQFGIVYHVQDELQAVYEDLGLDLPAFNGDDSFDLPVPATFVVDAGGVIRLAFVDPDYTRRLDPTDVLSVLRSLQKAV
ncbi:MAG: peroxiredoxin-like family protein [Candidatus Latescibacteria bacterium]|nr:peroxiredoxin-like family protein [Candidatus Latescibacterota bacterium]